MAYLLTFEYMEQYIFHSSLVMTLQSKALGTPHIKVNIKEARQDIPEAIARLNKEERIEGIVTGDIAVVRHKSIWDDICEKLSMELIMPLWDLSGGNRYRKRVLNMEFSTGMMAIINCIDLKYFSEEWLSREFDRVCVQEMKAVVGPLGIGVDATGESGEFHTTVLDSPLFKKAIEIAKFSRKRRLTDCGGVFSTRRHFLYMDIEEAVLRPKNH